MRCGTPSDAAQCQGSDMPYMRPKPKTAATWIPTQVNYGIDCSDDDPANWTPFGEQAEVLAVKSKAEASKLGVKTAQPGQ